MSTPGRDARASRLSPDQTFDFDVALSFAGEDRSYVQEVATSLQDSGVRVFYDESMVAELWGADLYVYLDEVYRKRARYTVVFVSEHYVRKSWTSHERQSAQARAFSELGPYLLPVRLDDTDLPGLRPTVGYVDGRTLSPDQIAELVLTKVGLGEQRLRKTEWREPFVGVPTTPEQQQQLLSTMPPSWKYLLWAGAMWQAREAADWKWRRHQSRAWLPSGRELRPRDIHPFITNALDNLQRIISRVNSDVGPRQRQWALREPADPVRIERLAKSFVDIYEEMMDWSAHIRGISVPAEFRTLLELLAQFTDLPVQTFRDFIEEFREEMDDMPDALLRGDPVKTDFELTISLGDSVTGRFGNELQRVLGTR